MRNNDNQLDDFFGLTPDQQNHSSRESVKDIFKKKLTFQSRFRLLPKVLSGRERYLIFFLLVAIGVSFLSIPVGAFYHFTVAKPDYGGRVVEGILGEPRLINPLLAQANDADRDLSALIYSGLLKYNEAGKLIPDLARSYEISSDGLSYTVYLRDNAVWHDGRQVTAEDVIFTISTAQNPDYTSHQRVSWQGVEIEKINDFAVRFRLKNRYAQFLNNLTMGILPKHLWEDVKPINFSLSELNLKPIGSGPFKFDKLKKDKLGRIASYELKSHEKYHLSKPYLNGIEVKFFNSEDEIIEAYNKNDVESLGFVSAQNLKKIKFINRLKVHKLNLPRYFGVFYNQSESEILADKNVRLALAHATDRNAIIQNVLGGNGSIVNSPMIPGILDLNPLVTSYDHDPDKARRILETSGWGSPDANGILAKGKDRLTFKITTSTFQELTEVAVMLKEQWKKIGIDVQIEPLPISQLQQTVKDRTYEALLFGEILNIDPDPFSLWHSSQIRDPGLNLALYQNVTADSILEEARQTLNSLERSKKYDDFQKIVIEDIPALFLYSPNYIYGQGQKVYGFETGIISMPADRFSNAEKWYINTKRVWKN
ncbi:MAG: ABC transporter substrate-binding protein [Candidatus Yanofskybacteria bacterium]|nr:ABC transporter substrate-binding protein [Candidatus Yanofskybacteria bacterium]